MAKSYTKNYLLTQKSYPTKASTNFFKANEKNNISLNKLNHYLEEFEKSIKIRDEQNILRLIKDLVPEWQKN